MGWRKRLQGVELPLTPTVLSSLRQHANKFGRTKPSPSQTKSEVFLGLGAVTVAGAVEAVGADFALRHTDGLDEVLEFGKLQGGEAEATGYLGDHALVLGRVGLGVLLQIYLVVALEVADDATRNQFQVAL